MQLSRRSILAAGAALQIGFLMFMCRHQRGPLWAVALGLLLAVATGRIVSGLLYQISALDPVAFTVAPIVLNVTALLACWLPARRATRINPLTALRTE